MYHHHVRYFLGPAYCKVFFHPFRDFHGSLSNFSGEGDEKKRPVIIHRAILGSVERMIAVLTENYGGKW